MIISSLAFQQHSRTTSINESMIFRGEREFIQNVAKLYFKRISFSSYVIWIVMRDLKHDLMTGFLFYCEIIEKICAIFINALWQNFYKIWPKFQEKSQEFSSLSHNRIIIRKIRFCSSYIYCILFSCFLVHFVHLFFPRRSYCTLIIQLFHKEIHSDIVTLNYDRSVCFFF